MREAMARAEVGDDVYGEDPTVAALEERVAGMFGHEAALFTPTGSMANVLAVASVVSPGEGVLCESPAHIARAELGAHGAITGLTMRTWTKARGQVDLPAIEAMHAPDMGPFFVRTAAVSVENTHNFAGGAVLPIEDLRALRAWAETNQTKVHLDGARLWNAHVATGTPLADYGRRRAHRCRGTAHRAPGDPPRRLARGRRARGRGAQPARRPVTLTSLIA